MHCIIRRCFMSKSTKIFSLLVILLIQMLCLPLTVKAQQNTCLVSGTVLDEKNESVMFASVVVLQDEKVVTGVISDEKGHFSVKVSQIPTQYRITIDFLGFKKKELFFDANQTKVELGIIVLESASQQLETAQVVAKSEGKHVTVERTSIDASSIMASEQGTVIDVLKASPAITVDGNNGISIRGNSNVLVLMDGVPTTMDNLGLVPAANIKSVEIITSPDASYDAEGTAGIVNIIQKKGNAKGLSALVAVNYGFNHFVNGNAAIHYNSKKVSIRFSYNTRYEDDILKGSLDREIIALDKSLKQLVVTNRTTFNTNIAFGTTYRVNERNTLDLDLKFNMPRLNTKSNFFNTYDLGGVVWKEYRQSDVTWNRENLDVTLAYKHVVPKDRTETIKASVSKIWGHRPSYYYLEGDSISKSNSGGCPLISFLQFDFKKMKPKLNWDAGAKMTYRRNDIFHQFYDKEDGVWWYSQQFSNDLLHQELIAAAYAMLSSKPDKPFSYKFGIRIENSTVWLKSDKESVNQKNNDIFIAPSMNLEYRFNKENTLALTFGRRIGRPTYPQLNPYMSMVDATTFEQGNMFLKPEKANNLELAYALQHKPVAFNVNLYASYTTNYIAQVAKLKGELLLLTYLNCPSDFKTGLDLSLMVSPLKWLNFTLSANTFYSQTKGEFEDVDINNKGWANNSNLLVNFVFKTGTSVQLQYFISSPQYYPQFTARFSHYLNVGIKQKFLKGALTVSALLTDAFATNDWSIYSRNIIYNLDNTQANKSRMFWLGISYNYNSFKQNKAGRKTEIDRGMIKL